MTTAARTTPPTLPCAWSRTVAVRRPSRPLACRAMRRAVLIVAGALLLGGSTALAFFSGGYFAEPRLIAAIAVWALVLALTLTGESPLPRTTPGRLALGGLVLLTIWSALSVSWAPLRGPATEAVERLVLYTRAPVLAVRGPRHPATPSPRRPAA